MASDTPDEPQAEQPLAQKLLVLEQWGNAQFPVACDAIGDIYLPVRALCLYLGIASQMQIKALRKSRSMQRYLRRFYLTSPSGGGRQAQWCLHIRALAFWLAGHIDVDAVRPELQQGLLEWQDTLIHAAHELFFGEAYAASTIPEHDLALRLNDALFEIRRLKTIVKLHSRRLGTLERFTLPDTYFDTLEDEDS
jgi:hypothetical protein